MYLDSAATSLTPESVIKTINRYYREYGVNIHRGIYELSERATYEYELVRTQVARFLNCPEHGEIVFTHGATESANIIAQGWGHKFLKEDDIILSTEYEHHSSLVPWHAVCNITKSKIAFIPIQDNLCMSMDEYKNLLHERVKIVVISGMSNVTGYLPPLKEIIDLAHGNNTLVMIDASQLAGHYPIDMNVLDPDFLFFSAHKMLGPTGVGILYAKKYLLEDMDPLMYGGGMILEVHKDSSTYNDTPQKFEAGTPNIAGVLGFGQAISYLKKLGMANIAMYENQLMKDLITQIQDIPSIINYLPEKDYGSILSFNVANVHGHDIGAMLDAQGIAVRTGFHCAMPLMQRIGITGTIRASLSFYNTREDVTALCKGIEHAQKILK